MLKSRNHNLIVKLFTSFNASKKKLNIVDYGCGSGALLDYLPKNRLGKYYGYDVSNDALVVAKQRHSLKNTTFHLIDKKSLPSFPAKSIDCIFFIGSWQYLEEYEQRHLLKEMRKALKPGGLVYISCSVDHWFYRVVNVYRLVLPNYFVSRAKLSQDFADQRFNKLYLRERGLIMNPLFSNVLTLFTDVFDRIVMKTKGTLGPLGRLVRKTAHPLLSLEYLLPIDYGYTLFAVFQKPHSSSNS